MLLLAALAAALPLAAQGDDAAGWRANWVTHPAVGPAEQAVVLFRRDFDLGGVVPDSFPVAVTADNAYRLYVNGAWVGFGPQLGEIAHWRYERYDLAAHLRPGRNTVAVQVVNWGHRRGFGIQSVHTGLLVQGYGPADEHLTTTGYDERWRARVNPGIRDHVVRWRSAPEENDIVGGLYANNPTDSLLAGAYPWGWADPDVAVADDDPAWVVAPFLEAGHRAADGSGFLWLVAPRTTPPQVRTPATFAALRQAATAPRADSADVAAVATAAALRTPEPAPQATRRRPRAAGHAPQVPKDWHAGAAAVAVPPHTTARFLLDVGAVDLGFPELKWAGGAGAAIKYTWAENLLDADGSARKPQRDSVIGTRVKGYFDVVRPGGGSAVRTYVPTWYRTFRYLEVAVATAADSLLLWAPTYERSRSSIPIVAEWASDDPAFDAAWEIGRRTVALSTQDYFLSDAYYETMQYVGDTKVHALVWQALSGDYRHTANALRDFNRSRNAEGILTSCYPLRYNFVHSSFSLIWVDMVADYLARSGDTALARELVPGVTHTLAYFDRHYDPAAARLRDVPYRAFVDWYTVGGRGWAPGADLERSTPVLLQYAHALASGERLLRAVGGSDPVASAQADAYAERRAAVVEAVRARRYDADARLVRERADAPPLDQHSTILGVLTGVVPPADRAEALRAVLATEGLIPATYYFRYYLLEALRRYGRGDAELARAAVEPWYGLVAAGATTQVERYDTPAKASRSEAHPWGTAPTLMAYALWAGIDFERGAAGDGGAIRMAPGFGHLREMRGYTPAFGVGAGVRFDLRREGDDGIAGWVEAEARPVEVTWGGRTWTVPPGRRLDLGG